MAAFTIVEAPSGHNKGYQPYGAALEYWRYKGHECILAGAAETGKTRAALEKLNAQMWKYAGAQSVIVRKVQKTLKSSVLQTWERKVLGLDSPVKPYGGNNPQWYDYPNGSRVWLAGMDNPGKALSSERDIVYVNQAEELEVEDWETILTRATGRAGNMPYTQVCGDCNPSHPRHWIKQREAAGKLRLFESRHEHNPTLFDQKTGLILPQGKKTLEILDGLTGVRLQRLRYSRWVSAEGVVYDDFDSAIHLIDAFEIPKDWRRIRSIDFGFTNPFVCQWWAIDPDGRAYRYREWYRTKMIVQDHAKIIHQHSVGETYEATVSDHDAEDRATLEREGIPTVPAFKAIAPGIQAIQSRLRKAGDGKPRIFYFRDALIEQDPELVAMRKPTSTIEEMDVYVWPKGENGKSNKEAPLKENDHGQDASRYAVAYVDRLTNATPFEFAIINPSTGDGSVHDPNVPPPDGWQNDDHLWRSL